MSSRIRVFVQYALILGVTIFLVWFSLQAIRVEGGHNKWDYILGTWLAADKAWLMVMMLLFMTSNIIRAERWRILLLSVGHPSTLYKSFLSLMIGYLVNLVIPRGGEVSRCFNLYKLDRIPVEVSFGTVVVERIVDLICLVIILVLAFAVEAEKLFEFIETVPIQPGLIAGRIGKLVIIILAFGILTGIVYWLLKKNDRIKDRLKKTWIGFKMGLYAVGKLENKGLFILQSVAIWVLYFFMTFAVIKAFDETGNLGISAVLSIFTIGAIAMAAPLPGGAGSYHVLLPAGLVLLYQLPQEKAVAFTFVFHGWQTLIMIIAGVVSLILTSFLLRNRGNS